MTSGYINSLIAKAQNSGNYGAVLGGIQKLVLRVFAEPLCTAKVYGSRELDAICEHIGLKVANQHFGKDSKVNAKSSDREHVVFVASRIQKSGGHTRVIEDFVSILPHAKKTIIVTEVPAKSDRLLEASFKKMGVNVLWGTKGTLLKKLLWLQQCLLDSNPGTVYLFNHHEDSVAVAGMAVLEDVDKYFYHHADHHLSLGLHLKGFKHIDFHAYGYHRCRNGSQIPNNVYLPLTATDYGITPKVEFLHGGQLVTCTAAGHNKLEVPHFVSYFELIPNLLASTGGVHIHIGRLSWYFRQKLQWNLQRAGVSNTRFIYVPWVPSVWKALHEHQVDLFIASFPIVGGKTLVEAMGAGVPIAVHDNPTSRFLGGVDMVYPEALCWREPEELIDYCKSVESTVLRKHSDHARRYYEQYYHPELLRHALQEGKSVLAPPMNPYVSPESDLLVAMQICSSNSPVRWFKRNIYYQYKILRSRIGCLL